jgi:hypothetical protein
VSPAASTAMRATRAARRPPAERPTGAEVEGSGSASFKGDTTQSRDGSSMIAAVRTG